MVDIPVFAWVARPIAWFFRFAWSKLRLKDGSFVSLKCLGDTDDSRPEFLYIGLPTTERTCLVRLLLAVNNEGRNPIRNLAVRVQLPINLVADADFERANPEGTDTFFSTRVGQHYIILNFETSLRIDEGAIFPILIRIRPSDWIEARTGGPRKERGNLVLTNYGASTPIRVVAFKMKVSAQADNIRACFREWDIWLTPTNSLDKLKSMTSVVAAIQRIWSMGSEAFIFPFLGSIVLAPSFRGRYQHGVITHLSSNSYVVKPESALFFDTYDSSEFIPVQIYRKLVANPGEEGMEFRDWVRSIRGVKPEYYK